MWLYHRTVKYDNSFSNYYLITYNTIIPMVENLSNESSEPLEVKIKKIDDSLKKQVNGLNKGKNQTIKDITQINEEINLKHTQYKKTVTEKAAIYKNNLEKKYTIYYHEAVDIKDKFHSIVKRFSYSIYSAFVIILLCILFIITQYLSMSGILQNPLVNGLILVLLMLVLLTFIVFILGISRKFNEINPKPIENLTTELGKIKLSDVEPYDFKSDISKQMDSSNRLISSAESALDIISSKIPFYKECIEDDHFRRRWELRCDEFQNALKFFGFDRSTQFQQLKNKPKIQIKGADDSVLDDAILEDASELLSIPKEITEIFIKYYRGMNTRILWDKIKTKPSQLSRISKILYDSNQMDIDKSRLSENEFLQITICTQEFNLGQLSKNSSLYVQIQLKIINYRKILIENGVSIQDGENNIINSINFNLPFENNFLNILSDILDPIMPKKSTDAYKKAMIAILLNDEFLFKDQVCRNAAEDEAVYILMTYHELLRKRKENNQPFNLNDLLENVDSLESTKVKTQSDIELKNRFEYFKKDLSSGCWWDDGLSLQRKMFDDLTHEVTEKIETLNQSISITKLFEKTFTEININTVDKAIDANLFSTYLILTTARKGHLLELLDPISIRHPDFSKRELSDLKDVEDKYGITLIRNGKPKYDFIKYSDRTRIGVLPRNTIFWDFVQEIKNDINEILQVESEKPGGEMDDIGMAFIRINPSKYSFGLLDEDIEKNCNVRTRNLHIAKIIAFLARDYTTNSEQYLLSAFDGKINLTEIFNQMSIFELIETRDMGYSDEYTRFLKSEELKKAILSSLEKEGISSFKGLSRNIKNDKENRKKLESIIREAITNEYFKRNKVTIQPVRLNSLVSELMKSLDSIASLLDNLSK